MTTVPSEDWPRSYLLQVHQAAVDHGLLMIEPISEANAKSLAGRLYRIRRRSDKAMAHLIIPEYHLVTVGQWRPGPAGEGQLPIIYNRLPDGSTLPAIRPATPEEIGEAMPLPPPSSPILTPENFFDRIDPAQLELKPDEVESFVDDLLKKATGGDQ